MAIAELLTSIELRVLGALIEKQISTPDYYPMTLNALVNASNQKNNRDPVVTYDAMTVELGLDALRRKNLVRKIIDDGGRTPKYAHLFTSHFNLSRAQVAILCELMLRGAQTPGELKSRTARLHDFENLDEVEKAIESLVSREPEPLAAQLPRLSGTREARFIHLLGEDPIPTSDEDDDTPRFTTAPSAPGGALERIESLENDVQQLKASMAELRQQFETLKQSPAYNPSRVPPLMRPKE